MLTMQINAIGDCRTPVRLQPRKFSIRFFHFILGICLTLVTANAAFAQCASNADCDDGNPCTVDKCKDNVCRYKTVPALKFEFDERTCDGQAVEIENKSKGVDSAATYYLDLGSDGSIDFSAPASSLPRDSTLVLPLTGSIDFTVIVVNSNGCSDTLIDNINIVVCNDSDACTTDACHNGKCKYEPVCSDGDKCTIDSCNNGQCLFLPLCDDGDPCTIDLCNADDDDDDGDDDDGDDDDGDDDDGDGDDGDGDDGVCSHVSLCDDGDACTSDACDSTGACFYTPLNCDDGDACTADTCDSGICLHERFCCISNADCDDGDICTNDSCDAGQCIHLAVICDDQDACTVDACGSNGCAYTPVDCSDGDLCTTDSCVSGICTNTPIICNDSNLCTVDTCMRGRCIFTYIDCRDGDPCTADSCGGGVCFNRHLCDDGDPCTADLCNADDDDDDDGDDGDDDDDDSVCLHRPLCDDDNPCTADSCNNGQCTNTLLNCDDGDACTHDECDDGTCANIPLPAVNAGPDRAVFFGYSADECLDLSADVSIGTPPYSYLWSTGDITESIDVCPLSDTSYCVTVTDSSGCSSTDCVQVCVKDVRCGSPARPRVLLCHNAGTISEETLCVRLKDADKHLDRHRNDVLGPCGTVPCIDGLNDDDDDDGDNKKSEDAVSVIGDGELLINAYPNPFSYKLNIEFTLEQDSKVKLEIFSIAGLRLALIFQNKVSAGELQKVQYIPVALNEGMLFYRLQTDQGAYFGKAVMVK